MCPTVAQRSRISPLVDERVCVGGTGRKSNVTCVISHAMGNKLGSSVHDGIREGQRRVKMLFDVYSSRAAQTGLLKTRQNKRRLLLLLLLLLLLDGVLDGFLICALQDSSLLLPSPLANRAMHPSILLPHRQSVSKTPSDFRLSLNKQPIPISANQNTFCI